MTTTFFASSMWESGSAFDTSKPSDGGSCAARTAASTHTRKRTIDSRNSASTAARICEGGTKIKFDGQIGLEEINEEYKSFVDKFKPKKTTDDCYTPPNIYEAIKKWACKEYGIDDRDIVRPFYPGGDYERFDYHDGCTVLDNPPFSILSKICKFYDEHGIKYFLFAPSLTCLGSSSEACKIISDSDITYENGAVVHTAFVTNLENDYLIRCSKELHDIIDEQEKINTRKTTKELPKYSYPFHVVTAAMCQRYAKYGVDYSLRKTDAVFIRSIESQRQKGKAIFGGGYLVSNRAAAERAAAERAAATKWELSETELYIINKLGGDRRDP